jgi:hypothetical protein
MPEPNRWYVSYTVQPDHGPRRYARRTKTFDTEEHAKLFVRELAVDNLFPVSGRAAGHARLEKRSP